MSRPVRIVLAAVALAALIVTGVAIIVPVVARPMVVDAVRAALPFGDQSLDVEVEFSVFGLLRGTIDRIHIHGTDLASGDVRIGALDATATGVATTGRSFLSIEGTMTTVDVPTIDGTTISIQEITVGGTGGETTATAHLNAPATIEFVQSAFADAGFDGGRIEIGSGTVSFDIFGQRAQVAVGVEDGAIVLVNPFGTGSFELLAPTVDDPWSFTSAEVTPAGLTVEATVDVGRLLPPG